MFSIKNLSEKYSKIGIMMVVLLFTIVIPIFPVSTIESEETIVPTRVQVPYNLTSPQEVNVSYIEEVAVATPVLVTEMVTYRENLISYTGRIVLKPDTFFPFSFELDKDVDLEFSAEVNRTSDLIKASIFRVEDYELFRDGEEAEPEAFRHFKGDGIMHHTSLFNDTYYFVIENDEKYEIRLKKIDVIKTWDQEETHYVDQIEYMNETKYRTEIQYITETKYRTEIKDMIETNEKLANKRVTLLNLLLKRY